jgi:hypothetical protein
VYAVSRSSQDIFLYGEMAMTKRSPAVIAMVFLFAVGYFAFTSSEAQAEETEQTVLYTAQNLWYENPINMWCINYKTGTMIPAGTAVDKVGLSAIKAGRFQKAQEHAISFERVDDGMDFFINFRADWHPGMTIEDYKELFFTEKDFDALTEGLAEKEIEAIKKGVVVKGMSKRAVLISYGVPPEHKTPDLDAKRWLYWRNRFASKEICFDDDDRAVDCATLQLDEEL